MRLPETLRRLPGQRATDPVPGSTGPDEVTVRLSRKDFRRSQRRHQRRHQRRRSRVRRHWRAVLAAVLAVALLAAGVWTLFFSPYVTARGVEVAGAAEVGESRVQSAVELPEGVPLARIDLDGIRDRVEAIPAVLRAEVSRGWPHTVRVQVVPREPVAVVAGVDGLQALDASGARFGGYASAPRGLPEVQPAGDLEGDALAEAIAESAAVVAALPADVAPRVRTVEVGSVDEIALVLGNGRRLVWGSAEQSETKAEVLSVLLADLPRGVTEVDVSVPGRPTTR